LAYESDKTILELNEAPFLDGSTAVPIHRPGQAEAEQVALSDLLAIGGFAQEFAVLETDGVPVTPSVIEFNDIQFDVNEPVAGVAFVSMGAGGHGANQHAGNVIPPGANQDLGDAYLDLGDIAEPANPAAGVRRLFVNAATGKLSVRTSAGSTVSLEETGGGGGGAPTDATYIVASANGSLSAEMVLGTSVVMLGTLAARPAAGTAGRLYYVTDAGAQRWSRDDGTAWADTTINWAQVLDKPSTFSPTAHAASHQHGGADEIATATAAANAIPKAGSGGKLASSWLPAATTSQDGATRFATDGESSSSKAVRADDARLSNARTPTAHTHSASDIASGTIATARLGSGTPDNTKFLRGDQIWATPSGGGLTVREVDGAPSVAAATTIEFNQAQGLSVSDQGSGAARVSISDATTSTRGVVTLAVDRETTAGEVVQASDPRVAEPWQRLSIRDHFLGYGPDSSPSGHPGSALPWAVDFEFGDPQNLVAEVGHPGILRLGSSTSDGLPSCLRWESFDTGYGIAPADVERIGCLIRLNSVNDICVAFGFASQNTLSDGQWGGANSILLVLDLGNLNNHWWRVARAGGAFVGGLIETDLIAVTGWQRLEIRKVGSNWKFYMDSTDLNCDLATSLVSAGMSPYFGLFRTGGVSKNLDIDLFYLDSVAL
jgi:hypothetical protein